MRVESTLFRGPPFARHCLSSEPVRLAAAAIAVAQKLGLVVPDDVSIAGFDDSPLAIRVEPKLTTVRQPVAEIAGQAVRLIIEAIRNPDAPRPVVTHMVEHQLIERDSTGIAPVP